MYWVHLPTFFKLVLTSWMVTLRSCLIWQIFSFILLFRWSSFLSWRVCKQAKLSQFGAQKARKHILKSRRTKNKLLFLKISRRVVLTPLDYYLRGDVKNMYYAYKPETIDTLKDNLREAFGQLQLHTIDNLLKNWTDLVSYCMATRGTYWNEIIFHYIHT